MAAPARRRTSPTLMRTVWVMITNDSNNKEREATDSLPVCGCSPVKEYCFPGARVLFWISYRRCHGLVPSIHDCLHKVRSFVTTFITVKRKTLYGKNKGTELDFSCSDLNILLRSHGRSVFLLGSS